MNNQSRSSPKDSSSVMKRKNGEVRIEGNLKALAASLKPPPPPPVIPPSSPGTSEEHGEKYQEYLKFKDESEFKTTVPTTITKHTTMLPHKRKNFTRNDNRMFRQLQQEMERQETSYTPPLETASARRNKAQVDKLLAALQAQKQATLAHQLAQAGLSEPKQPAQVHEELKTHPEMRLYDWLILVGFILAGAGIGFLVYRCGVYILRISGDKVSVVKTATESTS